MVSLKEYVQTMVGDAQSGVYYEFSKGTEYGQRDRIQVYSTGKTNAERFGSRSGTERFNKPYREGVLDVNLFETIDQVREITHERVWDFNNHRPHDALKGMSPVMFRSAPASPPLHED